MSRHRSELEERFAGQPSVLPPSIVELIDFLDDDDELIDEEEAPPPEPDPITAFVCLIDYSGETRLITCRRYDVIGPNGYVGAICSAARAYRQFRTDRIAAVMDACTGEQLGDGSYFARFNPKSVREAAPTWGLIPSQRATLVAGLNVLAFMAHCDGRWHPLESDPVERFVCSMWLRKEWPGDPPLGEIVAHARRLAPDADAFFRALKLYAHSGTSSTVLKRAVSDLIAADGVICAAEMDWGAELADYLAANAG